MGFQVVVRNDVQPIFPLSSFCCFDNRMGAFVGAWVVLGCTLVAWVLVILDLLSWATDFELDRIFPTQWKMPFWKGFVSVDLVLFVAHLLLIIICIIVVIAILKPYKIYRLYPVMKAHYIIMILHLFTELGCSVYYFSWYGLAAWRMPLTVFLHMFYIIRFLVNISFMIASYSYAREIYLELNAGDDDDEPINNDYEYISAPSGSAIVPATFNFE